MTLKLRFSLIGIGIVIFLIITPVLVLYARGFTIDWHNKKIVKTGAVVIKTDPAKALVFLNGKLQANLTPRNIRFLSPGDYDIRIEKDNYQPWTKRLTVKSQLVTWVNANREFITLFLKQPKLIETRPPDLEQKNLPEVDPTSQIPQISSNGNEIFFSDPVNSSTPDLILRSISPIANVKLNLYTGFIFFQNEGKIKAIELDGRDQRNIFTLVDVGKDFTVDAKGEKLSVIGETEIKVYQIR